MTVLSGVAQVSVGGNMRAAVWRPKSNPPPKPTYPAQGYDLMVTNDAPKPAFDASLPANAKKALIRVHAGGLNPVDCKMLLSSKFGGTYPYVGRDFSGVVEAIGTGDTRGIKVGDAVMGSAEPSFAEYIVADLESTSKKA